MKLAIGLVRQFIVRQWPSRQIRKRY